MKTQEREKRGSGKVLSCEFCKFFKNFFYYRRPPVAASMHVSPHLSHPLATSNRVPHPPFSNQKHYRKLILKTYIHVIYPLLQILLLLLFIKKISAGRLLLKKFIFICESSSYVINLLIFFSC